MPAYVLDQGLADLGRDIIQKDRTYLGHLKIGYMFRPEAPVSDGKVTAGMCARVDDRNRTIHEHDFIIEIAKDIWDAIPTDEFRRALMDHELGHCGIRTDPDTGDVVYDESTNRPKTYIKRHDIEEFEEVLERHGAYHKGLRDFLAAFAKHKSKKKSKTDEQNVVGEDEKDDVVT